MIAALRNSLRPAWLKDVRGSTAAEFALILTPLVLLTLGTINLGLMLYTVSTLHFAVQDTARWASIQWTISGAAPSDTAIQAHASAQYVGPTLSVTFVRDTSAACPNTIKGTADYNFTTGLTTTVVPLSVSSCYPLG